MHSADGLLKRHRPTFLSADSMQWKEPQRTGEALAEEEPFFFYSFFKISTDFLQMRVNKQAQGAFGESLSRYLSFQRCDKCQV